MTHRRKSIRDAVVTMLTNAAIVGSGKVVSNRRYRDEESDLPLINVVSATEESKPLDLTGSQYRRTLAIVVDVLAKVVDEEAIDDTLDALAESIESAFAADPTLGGYAATTLLASTNFIEDESDDIALGRMSLSFQVQYLA